MSDIIRLLPDSIANQIAAGEVIQRPASVIKELLENSVDAGSQHIRVIVKDAGKALIQVIDDGGGMTETDARMSFERHATSKIRAAEDLFHIRTMGFRGEALASIAAVAQVELKTRTDQAELGVQINIEASEVKKHEPTATPKGTSIAVKNLFYNIPARRNFLKSNPVEMKHILEEFQRVALANPEIAFSLYQNDLETYQLPTGKLSRRIVGLFGKNYREQLASCQEETPAISIKGYVGKPEFAKKTRGEQFFFVNNRFIKSGYLHHAVKIGYEGLIPDDCHPFYVLFIEIDPRHVDVNVHPTKTEVKFDDERTVYGVIRSAVRQSLGAHNITPSLDFSHDANIHINLDTGELLNKDFSTREDYERESAFLRQGDQSGRDRRNIENWERLFPAKDYSWEDPSGLRNGDDHQPAGGKELIFESAANNLGGGKSGNPEEYDSKQNTFQVLNRYIVTRVKSGLMLIDQQAAHERILYEKYLKALNSKAAGSQQSLFPKTVALNPGDFELAMELRAEIEALGFDIEAFGKNTVVINGSPSDIAGVDEKMVLEGLIEQYKFNKSELSLGKRESMARAMARQASLKPNQSLSREEMNALIDRLFACGNPNYAPNGNKTFFMLDAEKIKSFFNS